MASTSSATDWVTRTPSSAASARAWPVTAEVALPALSGQGTQLAAVHPLLCLAQRRPDGQHLLDLLDLTAYEQVDDPRGDRRLAQHLDPAGEPLSALCSFTQASRAAVNCSTGSA